MASKRNIVAVLMVVGLAACTSESSDGSTTPGGTGGAPGAGGATSGTVCPPDPKRNSCGRCVSDGCDAMFCAPCDGDPSCVAAWSSYDKCVAKLPAPASCTSNAQCPIVCLTTGKCSSADDSPCLPPIRANVNANALYQCIVDRIVPCSEMDACMNPTP